ncbi:hypothetical protein SKAU_G00022400 [Synaphobranchus kaupii]|uniref:Uncharacterized protein n=1 Tax=Synaphobranchus kaupii TaxID=118154 RepID=A0A9Q1JEJ2_SYNKA|nr:hypothetical protein SKAU_G00022400 [Synaphobranchus kaupii]
MARGSITSKRDGMHSTVMESVETIIDDVSPFFSTHAIYEEISHWSLTHTIQDEVLLTHVDPEAGPSARPDDTLQEPPRKRKCKRTRQPEQRDDAYETLLSRETERAEMQIRLAKEQIQLCRLQQTETSLRIQLLKARLDDPAAFE